MLNNTTLTLRDALSQAAVVSLASVGNYTQLAVAGGVGLQAGSLVQLSDNFENRITSNGAAATLTNAGTIQGAGRLGDGDTNLSFTNAGLVSATGANAVLLNTGGTGVVNTGVLQDTGAGGLLIQNTAVDNTGGGRIVAAGAGAHVDLQTATIIGGTLATTGGGVIQTVDRGSVLRGAALTKGSAVTVQNNTALTLHDALSQGAVVSLASAGNYTQLAVAGQVGLQAGSLMQLSDNFENRVTSNGAAATLTNAGTIQGSGRLGDGDANLALVNRGTIISDGGGGMTLNVAGGTAVNAGLLENTGAGGLLILGSTLDNTAGGTLAAAQAGTVLATGAGTHVDLQMARWRRWAGA